MTAQEIVTEAKSVGGIDVSDAQALSWVNDRYRRLVAGAKWRMLERSLGSTVADQARYQIADDIVDLRALEVGGSGKYEPVSVEELWDVKAGVAGWTGERGLFAPGYDDDTATPQYVELYPAPSDSGDEITALVAVVPPDLTLSDSPAVPTDFHSVVRDGVIADGMRIVDEAHDEADRYEASFQDGVERLRRRRNSRIGSGPSRIRLVR